MLLFCVKNFSSSKSYRSITSVKKEKKISNTSLWTDIEIHCEMKLPLRFLLIRMVDTDMVNRIYLAVKYSYRLGNLILFRFEIFAHSTF